MYFNTYKQLTDNYLKGTITDFVIDHTIDIAISQLHKHITNIILLTPAMQRFLDVNSHVVTQNNTVPKYTEREKAYIPHTYLNLNNLTKEQITIFTNTWCNSEFVEITNKKLVLKPYRCDPP